MRILQNTETKILENHFNQHDFQDDLYPHSLLETDKKNSQQSFQMKARFFFLFYIKKSFTKAWIIIIIWEILRPVPHQFVGRD